MEEIRADKGCASWRVSLMPAGAVFCVLDQGGDSKRKRSILRLVAQTLNISGLLEQALVDAGICEP